MKKSFDIKKRRTELGISQRELARQLKVSHSNVGFWEKTGSLPKAELLPKLAQILGVKIEELIGIQNINQKNKLPKGRLGNVFESVTKLPRRQQTKIIEVVEAFVSQNS